MKRVFGLVVSIFTFAMGSFAFDKTEYYGTWCYDNVEMTITADTIYIDETGNEGFAYSYDYNECTNTFVLYDTIYETIEMVMQFPIWEHDKNKVNVALSDTYQDGYEVFWINKKS